MVRRVDAFRGFAVGCCALLVVGAGQGLGVGPFPGLGGDPPSWVDELFYWMLFANAAMAILVGVRGLTPGVPVGLAFAGLSTLLALQVLGTFSSGVSVPSALLFTPLAALVLAAIGVQLADPRVLGRSLVTRPELVVTAGSGAALGEFHFDALSTLLWLLPALWADGMGLLLAVPAVLAGGRLLSTTGVRVHSGVVANEHAGRSWEPREVIELTMDSRPVRGTFVVVGLIGVLVVLLAPVLPYAGDAPASTWHTLLPCRDEWGRLAYRVDWSVLAFRWPNGCNGGVRTVDPRSAAAGAVLALGGVIGERVAAVLER